MRRGTRSFWPTLVGLLVVAVGLPLASPAPAAAAGTVSLGTLDVAYIQNFDSLASTGTSSTVPNGWDFVESGTNANALYTAGTGSSNAGDTYSFGAADSSERAFGTLLSGSLTSTIGASFTNSTGATIGALSIAYACEMWRAGVATRGAADRLDFQLSTNATSLSTGTWTDHDDLDCHSSATSTTVGAKDGNSAEFRSEVTGNIGGLDIVNGAAFWIRWMDFNIASSDDGLGIDDFSMTPSGGDTTAEPVINEFVANHTGTDTHEYIEVFGDPNTDYSAYSILQVEGDAGGAGAVDSTHPVGTTNADGIWFTGFITNGLENGTMTLLLVRGFTGSIDDLDTNDDGAFDSTPWDEIVDSVAISDGGAGDLTYSSTVLAPGFGGPFTPGGASRIPNGVDTDSVDDWTVNDFDGEGIPGFTGTPEPGEALNTPGALNQLVDLTDSAPTVVSTTPADGATGVDVDSDIEINFSEDVDVTDPWFDIDCDSGDRTATVSGGPTSYVLDPDSDFAELDECTVTVLADGVTDQDTDDPPDNMAADHVFSFTTAGDLCAAPFTPIFDIQGSGNSAAITGNVTTHGVVVGDFEGPTSVGLRGFYLQDLDGDEDATTSDGLFVFNGNNDVVAVGDVVRVTGSAGEFNGQTQVSSVTDIVHCGTGSVAAVDVEMPFPADFGGVPYLERFEGMLVRFPQELVIAEYFNYDRFGEIVLALPLDGEDRHFTPTSVVEPGAAANARFQEYLQRRITLDDGLGIQNPSFTRHPNGEAFSLDNRFRGGDTVANTVGVLGFDFGLYRIQPTAPALYTAVNLRPAEPDDVGGRLKVGALNMLNFYVTLDDGVNDICGPDQIQECRGADDEEEFDRQRVKLLDALAGMDSDVIGVNEIENTNGVEALDSIVAGLNAMFGAGSYSYIDTGTIGTDAIKVGLLYRPGAVTPVGDYAILDSSVDPRFNDAENRPALAQTFEENATGARFTVIVNHLKSKGSDCNALGDPDVGDGQGNCNLTRLAAAQALVDWAASDPTNSGDPDFLITGDLNSYALEDPIDAIKAGPDGVLGTADDYTDLLRKYVGEYAYTYVFDGQNGYLDYALANASLTLQVTGATSWLINADEPDILDYDTSFKSDAQDALFEPNAFRSSDHDPVIVGLDLTTPGRVTGSGNFSDGSFSLSAQHVPNGNLAGDTTFNLSGVGSFASSGYEWLVVDAPAATYAGAGSLNGVAGYEFLVSVHDGGNPGTRDRIRIVIWDASGAVVYDSQEGDPILAAPTSPLTSGNLRVTARR